MTKRQWFAVIAVLMLIPPVTPVGVGLIFGAMAFWLLLVLVVILAYIWRVVLGE